MFKCNVGFVVQHSNDCSGSMWDKINVNIYLRSVLLNLTEDAVLEGDETYVHIYIYIYT